MHVLHVIFMYVDLQGMQSNINKKKKKKKKRGLVVFHHASEWKMKMDLKVLESPSLSVWEDWDGSRMGMKAEQN